MDGPKVIDLDDHRKGWKARMALCLACHHRWTSVYREDTDPTRLECPACQAERSIPYDP